MIEYIKFTHFLKSQKVWEHDFEITSDPKGPQRGPIFWSGLRRRSGGHAHFPAKKGPQKLQSEIKCHNIDLTLAIDR